MYEKDFQVKARIIATSLVLKTRQIGFKELGLSSKEKTKFHSMRCKFGTLTPPKISLLSVIS